MIQLILHGIGDYVIQTDKWAIGKKNKGLYGTVCCLKHCITYALPFKFIGSWWAVLAIFVSHYFIDRTKIIEWCLAWKNGVDNIKNFGFSEQKPFALSIWLFIITDNVVHITCNYFALMYL